MIKAIVAATLAAAALFAGAGTANADAAGYLSWLESQGYSTDKAVALIDAGMGACELIAAGATPTEIVYRANRDTGQPMDFIASVVVGAKNELCPRYQHR